MSMIDLNFRPVTYWPESFTPEQLLNRIGGKVRREYAKSIFDEVGFAGLSEFLVREELDDAARDWWGAIHPDMLGGEYLPPLELGEVEIARISMRSVTSDQISVRARHDDSYIRYRVSCEYEPDGMVYKPPFDKSEVPLTLLELMELISGSVVEGDEASGGLLTGIWGMMMYEGGSDEQEIVDFFSLSSGYYPELFSYYHVVVGLWLEQNREVEEEDE